MRALVVAALLSSATPAWAHGPGLPIGPGELWHHWTFDLWIIVPLCLLHWLYGHGLLRLWNRAGWGRGIGPAQVSAFLAGELMLVLALVSPLDPLGETLLTAHMVQHGLLVTLAPLLLLAGRPGAALPWALPLAWRRRMARSRPTRFVARAFAWTLRPLPAAVLHGLALWLWHAPALFETALENPALHTLEHTSFVATALMFWWAVLAASRSRHSVAPAVAAIFITLLHSGFLGALITFAPNILYGWYEGRTAVWSIDTLTDQQLAGLVMWVPVGLLYLSAGLAVTGRLVGNDEVRAEARALHLS
jgi:putative membrane protein